MYYNAKDDIIELSVRELCALAFQSGDLDTRLPPSSRAEASRVGREVHQRLQKEHGEGYHPEVTLHHECRLDGLTFAVSGRADGVLTDTDGGVCMVEEIKTVSRPLPVSGEPDMRRRDMGQLVSYGYFLASSKGLSRLTLRLTYVCTADDEIYYRDTVQSAEELKSAFIAMLAIILPRAKALRDREMVLRPLARDVRFPYPHLREEQGEMIRELWRDMRHGQTVFAQAPTGIGKTISSLYPAVKCFGEGKCDKIFYLTAKSATRREAVGAVERLVAAGAPLRAVVIAAREPMCANRAAKSAEGRLTRYCNPDACPYAKGYYDRVEGVIQALLASDAAVFTPRVILEAAERRGVCPYELSLDLSERCDVVICDYNYVFSPSVYLKRYFSEGIPNTDGNRYIFLVDEAHNLPDRARDLYSASLALSEVTTLTAHAAAYADEMDRAQKDLLFYEEDRETPLGLPDLTPLCEDLWQMSELCKHNRVEGLDGISRGAELMKEAPIVLLETVTLLSKKFDAWLRKHPAHPLYSAVDAFAALLRTFKTAGAYYDRRYVTLTEVEGDDVRVSLVCIDPADILRPILHKAVASVLFSATLTPMEYFSDILGGDGDSVCVAFDSPFPPDRLCVAVADCISLRREDRQKATRQVVAYIAAAVSAKKGNYLVYFPSYEYLEKVREVFSQKYPKVRLFCQTPGMTHAERDAFISEFSRGDGKLKLGFCVLGGSFSEGVDLPGNSLIGVIILGTGIPGLSSLRNIMAEHYGEDREGEGYAYAYIYPGMNRVLQAAGRVIRRSEDKGVVILMDDRYAAPPYTNLYPDHWKHMTAVGDPVSLREHLERFWERVDGEDEKK